MPFFGLAWPASAPFEILDHWGSGRSTQKVGRRSARSVRARRELLASLSLQHSNRLRLFPGIIRPSSAPVDCSRYCECCFATRNDSACPATSHALGVAYGLIDLKGISRDIENALNDFVSSLSPLEEWWVCFCYPIWPIAYSPTWIHVNVSLHEVRTACTTIPPLHPKQPVTGLECPSPLI